MLTYFILQFAVLVALLGVVGFLVWFAVKITIVERSISHIPGPPRSSFIWGNLSDFKEIGTTKTFGDLFFDLHEKYGPVVAMRNLHVPMVSIVDPKAIKEILMNPEFTKSPINYRVFVEIFGERFTGYGLVSETNHEKWARHRRVINPAFNRQYLRELMETFNDSGDRLIQFLTAKADGKTEVDMKDAMRRVTLDVIAKIGFTMDQDMIMEDTNFSEAIGTCFEAALQNAMDIFLKYKPTKAARDYRNKTREALRLLRGTGETLIKQRLADQQAGKPLPKDILSYIIKTAMVEENFELVEMVDEFMIFFGAGQETTGTLLAFTLNCLGQYPHVKEKIQEEVDRVMGGKKELHFDDLAKLEYMALVFKETLRLFPPVGGTSRISTKPYQCGEYTIPANTLMQFLTYVMCRQEQFFKNPMTFDPERFLRDEDKQEQFFKYPLTYDPERFQRDEDKPMYAYFPFSLGPRSCIGQQFAMIEAKVILTKLFQNLNMDFVPGQKLGLQDRLTLNPTNDCLHYLTPR